MNSWEALWHDGLNCSLGHPQSYWRAWLLFVQLPANIHILSGPQLMAPTVASPPPRHSACLASPSCYRQLGSNSVSVSLFVSLYLLRNSTFQVNKINIKILFKNKMLINFIHQDNCMWQLVDSKTKQIVLCFSETTNVTTLQKLKWTLFFLVRIYLFLLER